MDQTGKIDILLVDDKDENLLALEAVLSSPEYNLIKKTSGAEALKYLLNNECAIILLDVQMPEMDGFEVAHFIKKSERSKNIPIIFITAISTDERFVTAGYKSGAVDYLFKPFEPDVLRSKVSVFAELYKNKIEIKRQNELIRQNDRKERERALAELEIRSLKREQLVQKKYKDLIESINHAVLWSMDFSTFSFLFVSPSAEPMLGYPIHQWMEEAEFWNKHVHPEDRNLVADAFRKLQEGPPQSNVEHRFIKADGGEVWLHTEIKLATKDNGVDLELRGLSVNITPIKQAEMALSRSEENSRFLAEASFLLSQSLDYEKTLEKIAELVVPRFADLYEICLVEDERKEFLRLRCHHGEGDFRTVQELKDFTLPLKARLYEDLSLALQNPDLENNSYISSLYSLPMRSAILIPLVTRGEYWGSLCLGYGASGRVYSNSDLAIVEDLALRIGNSIDNARLFREAQTAIRARDEFISIASHELKTPLTPLKLNTQLMIRAMKDTTSRNSIPTEKIKKLAESSDRQINRLSQLIDNLLDISRINIGKLELSFEEMDFSEMILEIVERFSVHFATAQCQVHLDIQDNITGHWDRFRVEQIVINLLTNASKYGIGKPIYISLKEENDQVIFSVQDQGIGIAKEDQRRIFERFERAVSTSHFGGLGLGLYIANEIVKAHGGQLKVESEMGAGSKFILEVPKFYSPQATSQSEAVANL